MTKVEALARIQSIADKSGEFEVVDESAFMDEAIESLAAEIHKVYCQYHSDIKGSEYWTKGDYSLLDEETKEADRYIIRYILRNFVPINMNMEQVSFQTLGWRARELQEKYMCHFADAKVSLAELVDESAKLREIFEATTGLPISWFNYLMDLGRRLK